MTTILLITVLIGITAAVVLMVYLIDRINHLEQYTIDNLHTAQTTRIPEAKDLPANQASKNSLSGLSGKSLWDAMCGKEPEGIDSSEISSIRSRYEIVLQKHIERIFADGRNDAGNGLPQKTPKNPVDVSTLRGVINSWIPPQHASTIYKVGYEFDKAQEGDMNRLSSSLDESCAVLYSRTDLSLTEPYSSKLLGSSEQQDAEEMPTTDAEQTI